MMEPNDSNDETEKLLQEFKTDSEESNISQEPTETQKQDLKLKEQYDIVDTEEEEPL